MVMFAIAALSSSGVIFSRGSWAVKLSCSALKYVLAMIVLLGPEATVRIVRISRWFHGWRGKVNYHIIANH